MAKEKRQFQHWGFECTCNICEESKTLPKNMSRKRKDLFTDLEHAISNKKIIDVERVERQLKAYEATFKKPATEVPRMFITHVYIVLANSLYGPRQVKKSVSMVLKGLECLGFVIRGAQLEATSTFLQVERWGIFQDYVVQAWIFLCDIYAAYAPHLLEKAEEYARLAYTMSVGEDVTFDTVYKRARAI